MHKHLIFALKIFRVFKSREATYDFFKDQKHNRLQDLNIFMENFSSPLVVPNDVFWGGDGP